MGCGDSPSLLLLPGPFRLRVIVRVLAIGQIDLFENYFYLIFEYFIPYNCKLFILGLVWFLCLMAYQPL